MSAHLAVLVNPHAGKGRGAAIGRRAVAALRAAGSDVRVYQGSSGADTARLAAEAIAARPSALVLVGGDGTLAQIVDTVTESGTVLTLVPAGTGNDFARALGLPLERPECVAMLALDGRRRRVDVAEITAGATTRTFVTVAALGFDACVSDRTNRLRWPAGRARYYLAIVIELLRLRPFAFTLTTSGDEPQQRPGTLIAIGNTASYGGGMPVCAGARCDDGRLDIVHVAPLSRRRLIALFPRLLRGSHLALPQVTHLQADSVQVSAPGLMIYADGEEVGHDACTVRVRPAALTVTVPETPA